jgi:Fic family protein
MAAPLENVLRLEPCRLEQVPPPIADRVVELARRAAQLDAAVPEHAASDLAGLVRIMNCYYSNLIEGHNTRPRDIERALLDQVDEERRELQLEALAHSVADRASFRFLRDGARRVTANPRVA